MSEGTAASEFAAARASLRDTVKWLIGAGLGAVLAAGISVTALGKLQGSQLGLALVLGMVALSAMMLALGNLLSVILVQPLTLADVLTNKALCKRLEDSGSLPHGVATLREVIEARQECVDALRRNPQDATAQAILAICNAEIAKATDLASFMLLADQTRAAIRQVALWMAVICLSTAAIGILIGRADGKDGSPTADAAKPAECVVTVAAGPPSRVAPITLAIPAGCTETRITLPAAP